MLSWGRLIWGEEMGKKISCIRETIKRGPFDMGKS